MLKRHVWLIAGFALAAGCTDALGPRITGRWAAPGIELGATTGLVTLRMPCVPLFRAPGLFPLNPDQIEFSGRVNEMFFRYDFTFRGRIVGDTLVAALTRQFRGEEATTIDYRMTRDGDSGLDGQVCIV